MKYLITGGEFNNKGAEAMTLVALKNIYQSDSNAEVYMFDIGTKRTYDICYPVKFIFIPSYILHFAAQRLELSDCKGITKDFLKIFLPGKNSSILHINKMVKLLQSIDYMIDISGYALGSTWGARRAKTYCDWINAVALNGGKVFLMPQSFGPFDFNDSKIIDYITSTLGRCKIIYAREENGYQQLKALGLNNVLKSADSVLLEKNFKPEDVIKKVDSYIEKIDVERNKTNVAIIPNERLLDVGGIGLTRILDFYSEIIEKHSDAVFYLVAHAGEDLKICQAIKEQFASNDNVILIDYVLLSFNYEKFAASMDFIIGSRYHSIIHSYKEYTPAIILGWAEKYHEVANLLNQKQYIVDLSDMENTQHAINKMFKQCYEERQVIKEKLEKLQQSDCYAFLRG